MVFISRLKLRNFKSFKAADITLPKTFICFAGPNGSGKSNLCDAIRFAMGEKSLRSLRAKKVRDLIHTGSRSAEVTIVFSDENGGTGYEIKRAIREDGKIRYRLNQERTTRSAILEALKRHSLDDSGRNTIAQGEVQRIINMNGKERRGIIDSVAGISDFEDKKKEAVGELETVEDRIKEARLVMGERKAFLDELEREKEIALTYTENKKRLNDARGTLLSREAERLGKELSAAEAAEEKLGSDRKGKEDEMAKADALINAIEEKRARTSQEIQARQKTNALIRRLEEIKAQCGSRRQLIEDKKAAVGRIDDEARSVREELSGADEAIRRLQGEIGSLGEELVQAEKELAALGGMSENAGAAALREEVSLKEKELAASRERLIAIDSGIGSSGKLIEAKRAELGSIPALEAEEGEESDATAAAARGIERLNAGIEASFARTREINARMSELDREMLELKEKASIFKVRSSPQLANPALSFIADLKGKERGIYGTVADLISFDPRYASAVEAAGGSRLLYVVVDSVDTATSVIERLKKAKAGRATFIPLDSVRTPPPAKAGKHASVLEVIDVKDEARRAAEYVFAETLLVDSVADAKRLGIGGARMVTLEGEIFERSGIVSGGRGQGGLLGANQLRKIEEELEGVKAAKESLMKELYSIREEESGLRAEKARLELEIKTAQMRRKLGQERRKETEQLSKRRDQLVSEIEALEQEMGRGSGERASLEEGIARLGKEIEGLKKRMEEAEREFLEEAKEASEARAELSGRVSSLRATREGKAGELSLRQGEKKAKGERLAKIEGEREEALGRISEATRTLQEDEKTLKSLEEEISSTSKEIEKLFERMKGHEEELQEAGKARAQARMEFEKLSKDLSQIEIKKATSGTRLEDIKSELASFSGFQMLDASRDALSSMIAESERILAGLGNVNMAAIEMFEKRKKEIEEVEDRIQKLDTEREAILSMIGEIEEHKKEAFMEAFQAVSQNFSDMFRHVNVGQGHLHLSDPASPFESGLFIKLRRNNQEHSLDALSGGEKTLVALMFIFALQFFKPAPFYILDEVDAALDKPNSKNLAELVGKMSADSQFIVVSHNDTVMSNSDSVIGVTKADGASKLVGIKLKQVAAS